MILYVFMITHLFIILMHHGQTENTRESLSAWIAVTYVTTHIK